MVNRVYSLTHWISPEMTVTSMDVFTYSLIHVFFVGGRMGALVLRLLSYGLSILAFSQTFFNFTFRFG